jgi:hypothetical protein
MDYKAFHEIAVIASGKLPGEAIRQEVAEERFTTSGAKFRARGVCPP